MAVVNQGILGPFTGKVGGVVGAMWKGINYVKGYVIPANPRTEQQQVQRYKFKKVQELASLLLPTLIATVWNPFASRMSGYNAFISSVLMTLGVSNNITPTTQVTKGNLESVPLLSATLTPATGNLHLTYSPSVTGNGTGDDNIGCLVIDDFQNKPVYYSSFVSAREEGQVDLTLPTGLTAAMLRTFIFASRGVGTSFMVSNSTGIQTT